MFSVIHDIGVKSMRESFAGESKSGSNPTSWLGIQRAQMNGSLVSFFISINFPLFSNTDLECGVGRESREDLLGGRRASHIANRN